MGISSSLLSAGVSNLMTAAAGAEMFSFFLFSALPLVNPLVVAEVGLYSSPSSFSESSSSSSLTILRLTAPLDDGAEMEDRPLGPGLASRTSTVDFAYS